jgi:predicted Rossmann fold nucleotide-binding protein DprA/Smf involved in DNA uptake
LIKNGAKLITEAYDIVKDFEYRYLGILNPFAMAEPSNINMFDVFRELEVSCVVPNDECFNAYVSKTRRKNKSDVTRKAEPGAQKADIPQNAESQLPDATLFDKNTIAVYKKIPMDIDTTIEALSDDEYDVRAVMRALMKLEMNGFIEMLPGERVRRKIN